MHFALALVVAVTVASFGTTESATTYELEANKFIKDASERYYKLYNQIAAETYASLNDEDFEAIFTTLETVKTIANELVAISQEASDFDLTKIHDAEIKAALQNLRKVGDLFVLGEDYYSSVLIILAALKELSVDKDIEPYLGGANMPDQDSSPLAYFPDIQKIFQSSNDPEELKYYWETWRDKNLVWSSVNFFTILEAFQKAAKIIDVPILEFWYRCYDNKNFLEGMERVMEELKPFYQQFHAYVRQELFEKYGADVVSPTGPIPDHLFQQVLEQAWTPGSVLEKNFAHSKLPPYDEFVKELSAKQLIDESERFYSSLGFDALDADFYKNQLKEHDDTGNSGDCKADIFDITPKVYMKYCKKVDFRKFLQNHGYLSHLHYAQEKCKLPAYYFSSYDLEYPVGEAVILAASTPKHLGAIGLAKDFEFTEDVLMNRLFRMGIHTMFSIPLYFVHTKVMTDLLSDKIDDIDSVNRHYWKLMEKYAGVEPPVDRVAGSLDFPYKFYLDLEQNHQTKKFVSEVLGYQFYREFCKKNGQTGQLHNCDFYGNLSVGNDLKAMMSLGSSKPWREVISKVLPNNPTLSADALLEYYSPVHEWLKNKNKETKAKIGWDATKKKVL